MSDTNSHKSDVAVSVVAEKPVAPPLRAKTAKKKHRQMGYRPYKGPKIVGERSVIGYDSPLYPAALKAISRPPKMLYCIGNPESMKEGLAIIGARKATPYGIECAQRFGTIAAEAGVTIISGGARGCDSAAHRAALHAGTPTVVFLGGGCDSVYPPENFDMFQKIVMTGGVVVSENEWDAPPLPGCFPARNRLIAGLARATLIVEAGLPSGTFSTADEALDADKEVLVVPGAITSATSRGANTLLSQGAYPVIDDETFRAKLEDLFGLQFSAQGKLFCGPSDEEQENNEVLAAISARPASLEEIAGLVGTPPAGYGGSIFSWVAQCAEEFVSRGIAVRLPDGRYAARVR